MRISVAAFKRRTMQRLLIVITGLTTLVAACGEHTVPSALHDPSAAAVGPSLGTTANPNRPGTTVIVYDDFHKPGGYTLADYSAKWTAIAASCSRRTARSVTATAPATDFRLSREWWTIGARRSRRPTSRWAGGSGCIQHATYTSGRWPGSTARRCPSRPMC